jgi:hypothetical protein
MKLANAAMPASIKDTPTNVAGSDPVTPYKNVDISRINANDNTAPIVTPMTARSSPDPPRA